MTTADATPRVESLPVADHRCAHCTLPVPRGLVEAGAARQFCCQACRTVHEAIRGCGLDRYYELRDRQAADAAPARATGRGYEEFDDPAFTTLYCRDLDEHTRRAELFLEGVHCVACVWLVEKLPQLMPGVLEARLDLGRALLHVTWDTRRTGLAPVARAIDRLGYAPHPARGAAARDARRREDRAFLARIAVAGALAGNAMLIALALYSGMFGGMEARFEQPFRWISLALGLASVFWPGRVFLRGAAVALRTRTRHLDLPIAIGLLAAVAVGAANTLRGAGDIYFDSVTTLVFFLLCGRWIQHRRQRAATDSVELLFSLTPSRARLWEAGQTRDVPVDALSPGALVEVRAEESFPADGRIVEGSTDIDLSILTGESRPSPASVGDGVAAGAVNLSERVLVRVTAAGAETRVGRLMRLVEESALRRAPIVTAADRIAGWFVATVIALAVITLALWLAIDPSRALPNALALLIVTCPCALGLATPLAVTAAIGSAAREGIMIKGGEVLERLNRPGTILLDKTGTITEGRQRLTGWWGDHDIRATVAAVESRSSHPVARALARSLEGGSPPGAVEDVRQHQGRGISATVDGATVEIGSASFVLGELRRPIPPDLATRVSQASSAGETPVLVARAGGVVAVAALGDAIRSDAPRAIESLRRDGWRLRILSGDEPAVVTAVGVTLGIPPEDCLGGASPERKLAVVEETLAEGTTVMVGDGVNDAAALARATVGVAVSGGAEASLAAADVFTRSDGLGPIVRLTRASRRAVRAIHLALGVSLAYNALAASLAIAGLIHPLVAAVLMPASSLSVLAISLRARTFGDDACL